MKYFVLLIISILFFSCENKKIKTNNNFEKNVLKVRIWSYPVRSLWDVEKGKERQGIKIENNKIKLDSTKVIDDIVLNLNQKQELFKFLHKDVCGEDGAFAACYLPRHLIIFYGKDEKIIGFYEFCIGCGGSLESKNLKNYPSFCMEKGEEMELLLKKFGLKIISESSKGLKEIEIKLGNQLQEKYN